MNTIIALLVGLALHSQVDVIDTPNHGTIIAIQCAQCKHWYLPSDNHRQMHIFKEE